MSYEIRPAPDLRTVLMAWLRQEYPAQLGAVAGVLRVRTEAPADLRELLEGHEFFAAVRQFPGRSSRTEVTATLDLEVFALTDAAAGDLARDIDARLARRRLYVAESGASLHNVINQMLPVTVPWADPAVRRYQSSYAVTARR